MDVLRKELRRLFAGNNVEEMPSSLGLMSVMVDCPDNAEDVLTFARELFAVIIASHLVNRADDALMGYEHNDDFDHVERWCAQSLVHIENDEGISPTDYVPYLNEGRDWFWWDARVINPNLIHLRIEIHGFPVSGFDALRNLMISCGANSVEQDE